MPGQDLASDDPLDLEGAEAVDEGWEEARLFTPLYHWQLTMVADRKVSPDAVVLWHCLLTFGRKTRRCLAGNALLAARLGSSERSIRRHLRQLIDAGWLSVSYRATPDGGTVRTCLMRKYPPGTKLVTVEVPPTGQNASADRPKQVSRPASSGHRTNRREPEEENHTPTPQGGEVSVPAEKPKKPRAKRGPVKASAETKALAAALLKEWPHAINEAGFTIRRSTAPQVQERLERLWEQDEAPVGSAQRMMLEAALVAGAKAMAAAAPKGSRERQFVPGLHVWLNPRERRWEAAPEHVGTEASTVYTGSALGSRWKRDLEPDPEARRLAEEHDRVARAQEDRELAEHGRILTLRERRGLGQVLAQVADAKASPTIGANGTNGRHA